MNIRTDIAFVILHYLTINDTVECVESIVNKIDTDNFMLILGMISTYFFTKKSNGDDHNE